MNEHACTAQARARPGLGSPGAVLRLLMALVLCLLACHALAAGPAEAAAPRSKPGPQRGERVPLPPELWTAQERWVWAMVAQGQTADFNDLTLDFNRSGRALDPNQDEDWQGAEAGRRVLRPAFLQTILLHEPWRRGIGPNGVKIMGALFRDQVNLTSAEVPCELWLENSRFPGGFKADHIKVARSLSLEGSYLAFVSLSHGKIMELAAISRATVKGLLGMEGIQVTGTLYLDKSQLQETRMCLADIEGALSFTPENDVAGNLDLSGISVGGALRLKGSSFTEIDMQGAKINGLLEMSGARFLGPRINLKGAQVGAVISSALEDWPDHIEMERLEYNYMDCFDPQDSEGHMSGWTVERLAQWLSRQKRYSPQPYEQCAKILREAGQPDKANDILFLGKERERANASGWHAIKMFILRYTIGYGLGWRYFLSLIWAAALVVVGAGVFAVTPEARVHGIGWCFGFSLHKLLPVVNLGRDFSELVVHGWPKAYFIFHQLAGWVLASFIIAGLAGLAR